MQAENKGRKSGFDSSQKCTLQPTKEVLDSLEYHEGHAVRRQIVERLEANPELPVCIFQA